MYDPKIGRFDSEDPLHFGAGDPNLYRYASNEPTGWVDPSGLERLPGFLQRREQKYFIEKWKREEEERRVKTPKPPPGPGRVYSYQRPAYFGSSACLLPHRVIMIVYDDGTWETWSYDGIWKRNDDYDKRWRSSPIFCPEYDTTGEHVKQIIEGRRRAGIDDDYNPFINNCQTTVDEVLQDAVSWHEATKPKSPPEVLSEPSFLRGVLREAGKNILK
jgi:hypothetical protein